MSAVPASGRDDLHWYEAPEDAAQSAVLADAFRARYGHPPAGVWASPGRVNLIGEHTDYNGGLCLPIALPHKTFAAASAGPEGRVVATSVQRADEPLDVALADVGRGRPAGWGGYVAGAVAMLHEAAGEATAAGVTLALDSDVPLGAGLSSSAALSCSTALAYDELRGLGWADDDAGRARLAAACVRAENEVVGASTGGLDQAASLRCSAGHALLLDCRDGGVRQVPLDLAGHGLSLLVIDTRAEHSHADGEYAQRRAGSEDAARRLGVANLREVVDEPLDDTLGRLPDDLRPLVRHVVTEIRRVDEIVSLLESGRVTDVGPVMDASHASMRDDYRISADELDVAVETATAAGALGARMTGGGFGGSAVALVPTSEAGSVARSVDRAFRDAGWRPPAFLLAEPSSSGHRVL